MLVKIKFIPFMVYLIIQCTLPIISYELEKSQKNFNSSLEIKNNSQNKKFLSIKNINNQISNSTKIDNDNDKDQKNKNLLENENNLMKKITKKEANSIINNSTAFNPNFIKLNNTNNSEIKKSEKPKNFNRSYLQNKNYNLNETISLRNLLYDKAVEEKAKINNLIDSFENKKTNQNYIKINFFDEFITSFGLNFFSEIGDKSFIAIFLLTNQVSWFTLFIVASTTEIIVNFISVVIGYSLRSYESIYFIFIYITIFTTFLFGFCLLKEALENEEEKEKENVNENINKELSLKKDDDKEKENFNFSKFIFNIFKISWVVMLSELGDKSQVVTIMLSTHHNPIPVFLGTAIAHTLGVLISILLGNIVSSKISNKIMSFIASICFILYGMYVTICYFFMNKIIIAK